MTKSLSKRLLATVLIPIGMILGQELAVVGDAMATDAFAAWLAEFKEAAIGEGISQHTLDSALAGVRPIARVIELDRQQPEGRVSFERYLSRAANGQRVGAGREQLAEHGDLLDRIGEEYGVEPALIVALWGVETDYGSFTGGMPVIGALVTLAYDGRRATFFRHELVHALRIIEDGHIAPEDMRGSWAGAMGQAQFMPSSFNAYSIDHDGDGRKDIWGTLGDVFASIANYMREAEWQRGLRWGTRASVPAQFDRDLASIEVVKTVAEWRSLGVQIADDAPAIADDLPTSLIMPGGSAAFLVTDNYRAIMKWNRSIYFATAVGHLVDRIGNL